MKVGDIMTTEVASCAQDTNLAAVAASMWQNNCGLLPIVDERKHVSGVITDRDICIALATRNRLASELTAGEVTTGTVHSCRPEEEVQTALATMQAHKVRRVPVVDHEGTLTGIVSIDDIVLAANENRENRNDGLTYSNVVETLKQIAGYPIELSARKNLRPAAKRTGQTTARAGDFDFEE